MYIIRQQGQVFQAFDLYKKPLPPEGHPQRGIVSGFSIASRRRLIDFLCRMDEGYKRAAFVTLTFHRPPTPIDAKKALKRFLERCRDYFPEASAVWRMELQPSRAAIHFHLIFFDLPFWPQYHLQDTWTECTDEILSIADIRLIRKFNTYMRYVSKYVAKAEVSEANPSLVEATYQQEPEKSSGRFWGYHQKALLPLGQLIEFATTDEQIGKYALFACTGMSHGHCGNSDYTRKAYTPEAKDMYRFAFSHASSAGQSFDKTPSDEYIAAQWFGGTGVLASIGVPLAAPSDWTPVNPTLWNSLSSGYPQAEGMPNGECLVFLSLSENID